MGRAHDDCPRTRRECGIGTTSLDVERTRGTDYRTYDVGPDDARLGGFERSSVRAPSLCDDAMSRRSIAIAHRSFAYSYT